MLKKYSEYIAGGFMILVGVIILIASMDIKRMAGVSIGSDFFPRIAAVLLLVFGAVTILGYLCGRGRAAADVPADETKEDAVVVETDWKAPMASVLLLGIYIGLLNKIGFIIMTVLYLFAQITVLAPREKHNYLLFAGIAAGVTLIVYLLFVRILSVMLPSGLLG